MNQPIQIYTAPSSPAPANSFKGQASNVATGSEESFAALLSDGEASSQTGRQTGSQTDNQTGNVSAPQNDGYENQSTAPDSTTSEGEYAATETTARSADAPASTSDGDAAPTETTGNEPAAATLDNAVTQTSESGPAIAGAAIAGAASPAHTGAANALQGALHNATAAANPSATPLANIGSDGSPVSAQKVPAQTSGLVEGALTGNGNASSASAQATNMQTANLQSANSQAGSRPAAAGDDIVTPGMMAMAKGLQQAPGLAIASAQANDNGRKVGLSQSGNSLSGNPFSAGQINGQNIAVTMAGGSASGAGNNGGGNGSPGNLSQELLAAMTADGDEAALPGATPGTGSAAVFSPAAAVAANSATTAASLAPGDAVDSLNNATANAPGHNIPADRSEQTAPIVVRLSPTLPPPAAQIGVQISRALAEGVNRFNIQMHPADLGRVEVRMEVGNDGRVTALLSADKQDTLDLLQRDSKALERALQESGLKADSNSLSFSLREEQQNPFSTEMADADDAEALADDDILIDDTDQAHLQQRHDGGVDIRI